MAFEPAFLFLRAMHSIFVVVNAVLIHTYERTILQFSGMYRRGHLWQARR